jgi:predicted peptidase
MAKVAFWVFHGGADPVVNPDQSRNAVKALKEAGATVKYTEYPGVGHDSWSKAYKEPELVEWLFSQSRKGK